MKSMSGAMLASASVAAMLVALPAATALANDVYGPFPVTVKGYKGDKKNSVGYTGQIARHVIHDSLKKLAGQGNGKAYPALKAKMMSYFKGKAAGRAVIAPKTKGDFAVKQTGVDDISKKKNLAGKTFKGTVTGMPNGMTGGEFVEFRIDKASSANKGVD